MASALAQQDCSVNEIKDDFRQCMKDCDGHNRPLCGKYCYGFTDLDLETGNLTAKPVKVIFWNYSKYLTWVCGHLSVSYNLITAHKSLSLKSASVMHFIILEIGDHYNGLVLGRT